MSNDPNEPDLPLKSELTAVVPLNADLDAARSPTPKAFH